MNKRSALREVIESGEPILRKVGQFLSLKPDLIDIEHLNVLIAIPDEAPSLGWESVHAILCRELGADRRNEFQRVEETPVRSAFATQTHRAWLADGSEVLVKIARPVAPETVLRELRSARRVIELSGVRDKEVVGELIVEFGNWILDEFDLRRELENLRRLRQTADDEDEDKDDEGEVFMRPYPALSGPRVLTLERLEGQMVADLMRAGANVDVADDLAQCLVRKAFRCGVYNRSLLPDQVMVLEDGRISFGSFALVGELDEGERRRQLQLLSAVYEGDLDGVSRELISNLTPGEETDIESFRRRWLSAARDYVGLADTDRAGVAGDRRSVAARWLTSLLLVARDHHMWMPSRAAALYRTLLALETMMLGLDAACEPATLIRDALAEERERDTLRLLEPANLRRSLVTLVRMLHDSPGDLQNLLAQLADGTFRLRTYVTESSNVLRARYKSARLITTAILCVCVAVLLTAPSPPSVFGAPLSWPLWALLVFLLAGVCLQWIRLR
jgi:ubiquinone biosynthesis protein